MKTLQAKFSKKKLIILIVIGVVVLIGLLTGLAFWLKGSAETGATQSIKQAHTDVTGAVKTLNTKLADTRLSPADRVKAFDDLEKAVTKTDDDTCSSEGKNILFGLSGAKSRCDDVHKQLSAIKTSVEAISGSIKDDQTLAGALAPIKAADAANAAKQLEAWSTVGTNISKANVSKNAMGFKNHLMAVADSYKQAWKELTEADKAQNKTNYDGAVKKLDAAKDELSKVASDQTTAFKKNLTEFKQAIGSF